MAKKKGYPSFINLIQRLGLCQRVKKNVKIPKKLEEKHFTFDHPVLQTNQTVGLSRGLDHTMNWKETHNEIDQLQLYMNTNDGWRTLTQKLFESSSLEVTFFCLSGIAEFVSKRCVGNRFCPFNFNSVCSFHFRPEVFTPDDMIQLKQGLFTFIFQHAAPSSQGMIRCSPF